MKLDQKRVLLTGGNGGLGQELCQRLLRANADVTVLTRGDAPPAGTNGLTGDLSTQAGITAVADTITERPFDMLINLAGIQLFGPFEEQGPAELVKLYMVNLIAPALLARAVLPGMMRRQRGMIVNIGSIYGSINFAHFAAYSSAKAGLHGLSQALRRETAGSGVDVVYVAPRAVRTPFNSDQVLEFARRTGMSMDRPQRVAARIMRAIRRREAEVFMGFPEAFFVRLNALFPGLVDNALAGNDRLASQMFTAPLKEAKPCEN